MGSGLRANLQTTPAFFSVAYAPFFVTVLSARAVSFTVTNRFSSATQRRFFFRFGSKVRGDDLGHVLADAALFLGQTAAMDFAALGRTRFGDAADFHRKCLEKWGGDNGGASGRVKGFFPVADCRARRAGGSL